MIWNGELALIVIVWSHIVTRGRGVGWDLCAVGEIQVWLWEGNAPPLRTAAIFTLLYVAVLSTGRSERS